MADQDADTPDSTARDDSLALLRSCFRLPRLLVVEGNDWGPPLSLVRDEG